MASENNFELKIAAKGGHAAQPHMLNDPLIIAVEIILVFQSIVSLNIDPKESAVISYTEIETNGTTNIIPSNVVIEGDVRTLSSTTSDSIKSRMEKICTHICKMNESTCFFKYTAVFRSTINDKYCVNICIKSAAEVVGAKNVLNGIDPNMPSEDFSIFAATVPACFALIGNGSDDEIRQYPTP